MPDDSELIEKAGDLLANGDPGWLLDLLENEPAVDWLKHLGRNETLNWIEPYLTELHDRINAIVGLPYQGLLQPVDFSSNANFPFFWQDSNGYFNLNTYKYIDRLVGPGMFNRSVKLSGPFSNAYAQVVTGITYSLSSQDVALLNNTAPLTAQASAVVAAYEAAFGDISPVQLQTAASVLARQTPVPKTEAALPTETLVPKTDYVISYILGYQWSGRAAEQQAALTLRQMLYAKNLELLLPQMPAAGVSVLNAVSAYFALAQRTAPIRDAFSLGNWTLSQLRANGQQPAMLAVDSNGVQSKALGYTIGKPVSAILADLQNMSRAFSLAFEATVADQPAHVGIQLGTQQFTAPVQFLHIMPQGGQPLDLFGFPNAGQHASIAFSVQGWSMVPVQPALFASDSGAGWFAAEPIAEAYRNGNGDVSGYRFASASPLPYDLAKDGNFGIIEAVLISNYPTFTITYHDGSYSDFIQRFGAAFSANVYMLGLFKIGQAQSSLYHAAVFPPDAAAGSFTISLTPSPAVSSLDQTAFVLGAVVDYIGAGT